MPFDRLKELLALIAKVRNLFPDLSLDDLLALLAAAGKLLPLPDLDDEAGCRQWCRTLCGVLDEAANLTTTGIDDSVVAIVRQVVDDDTLWTAVWDVVGWIMGHDDPAKVAVTMPAELLGDKLGIDPAVIVAIIQAIMEIIRMFRK